MRVIVCPDSFKGVLSARAAAEAMARGVRAAKPDADVQLLPMADGGEGTLDVLLQAEDGQRRLVAAHGPRGDPLEVPVGLIRHASTAVVEVALVAGYGLISGQRRDPMKTSTFGLGEVIRAAVESEVETIILGLGGSSTIDGGAGMMQALGLALIDVSGRTLPPFAAGGDLQSISRIAWDKPPDHLDQVQFTIACDVLNPACGPNGAAAVFGPQKGADPAQVQILDRGLAHWADLLEAAHGRPIRDEPGTGAAGAVALPLLAMTHSALVPGVDLVAHATGLVEHIGGADLVLTGEGRLDRQSMMGKVVGAVGRMARGADVPCVAIVGETGPGAEDCLSVLDRYHSLDGPLEETAQRLERAAATLSAEYL